MTQMETRPILHFVLGSHTIRLNTAGERTLDTERATITHDPRTQAIVITPDERGNKVIRGCLSGGTHVRSALHNGFRKDRKYIGYAFDDGLVFPVDQWEASNLI